MTIDSGDAKEAKVSLPEINSFLDAVEWENLGEDRLIELMPGHDPFDSIPELVKPLMDMEAVRRLASGGLTDEHGRAKLSPHVVLSADIRKSTYLMKESTNLSRFAQIMTNFINNSRTLVAAHGGWFDKFMGDGFLAYWPCELYKHGGPLGSDPRLSDALMGTCRRGWNMDSASMARASALSVESAEAYAVASSIRVAELLISSFTNKFLPEFRRSSRNLLSEVGLTVGLDVGDVLMTSMEGELAIVGHPIVGAVRMTSVGRKGEIIANSSVWASTENAIGLDAAPARDFIRHSYDIARCIVDTKEYVQEAYRLTPRSAGC